MGLTQAQRAMIEKARTGGGSGQAIALTDAACAYLVAVIVNDLRLQNHFPELPDEVPELFECRDLASLTVTDIPFPPLIDRLVSLNSDADTFFVCLANLHKRRLKYERILQTQPIPTIEQVGPRGLLQYGTIGPRALAGLLFGANGCSISITARAKRLAICSSRLSRMPSAVFLSVPGIARFVARPTAARGDKLIAFGKRRRTNSRFE